MKYFSGTVYRDGKFSEGFIGVEDGVIKKTGRGACPKPLAKGVIVPTFINAHTHIGDSAVNIDPKPTDSFMELVAPPNSLKHRMLASMPESEIVGGMRISIKTILSSGVSSFVDFREGGVCGVGMMRKALKGSPVCGIALGRPDKMEYHGNEIEEILDNSDGIGASSVLDWDYGELEKLSKHTHRKGKIFALHANERVREDIDKILDLKPSFLVHMNEATDADLARCADAGVPVAICPRSNIFFGKVPDIPKFIRNGVTLMLGTDNAMISRPDFFRELETAYRIGRLKGGVGASEILRLAIENPRKTLRALMDTGISENERASFIVLDLPGNNAGFALLAHATARDISHIQMGKWSWRLRA